MFRFVVDIWRSIPDWREINEVSDGLWHNEWTADSLYINPDNIAQEMFGDWNSPEAVVKAAEHATKLRYECLEQKRDFVCGSGICL